MTIEHERLCQVVAANRTFGWFGEIAPIGGTPGNIFYVDGDNGNDNNDGTMISTAKQTIGAGMALLTPNNNDILIVLPGIYNEQVSCDRAGVHIFALGLGQAEGMSFNITQPSVEIAGFKINHSTTNPLVDCGPSSDYLCLHNCEIRNGSGRGLVLNNSLAYIEDNLICDNASHGIHILNGSNGAIITRNKIVRNGGDGIHGGESKDDETDNLLISENYICANVGYGIYLHHYFDNNNLFNNIITNNNVSSSNTNITDWPDHVINGWVNDLGIVERGMHTITAGAATTETPVISNQAVTLGKEGRVSVTLDLNDLENEQQQNVITVRLYKMIHDPSTNYNLIDTAEFDINDPQRIHPTVSGYFTSGRTSANLCKLQVTIQCQNNLSQDRVVHWKLICEE